MCLGSSIQEANWVQLLAVQFLYMTFNCAQVSLMQVMVLTLAYMLLLYVNDKATSLAYLTIVNYLAS